MSIRWARRLLVVLAAVQLAACTRPDGEWVIERIDSQPVSGPPPIITFEDGFVSASAGCNRVGGGYEAGLGGRLKISSTGTTALSCRGPDGGTRSMSLEGEIGERLWAARSFKSLGPGQAVIDSPRGQIVLRARPAIPAAVEGDWLVCRSFVQEPLRVVQFHRGVVTEWAGCRGTYEVQRSWLPIRLERPREGCATAVDWAIRHPSERARKDAWQTCRPRFKGAGHVLKTRFEQTPACSAAIAAAQSPIAAGDWNQRSQQPELALFAARPVIDVEFTRRGMTLGNNPANDLSLCRAEPADLVPRAQWTLEGDWVGNGSLTEPGYRITFRNGAFTETGGCHGAYRLDGERLTLRPDKTPACRGSRPDLGLPKGEAGPSLLAALPREITAVFNRHDWLTLRFTVPRGYNEMFLQRPKPDKE